MNLEDLRRDFGQFEFTLDNITDSPNLLLKNWLEEASDIGIQEMNAMVLSTVNHLGRPSSRVVLLKGIENGELSFYSNYESRKGQELAQNHNASVLFFWKELERQIRVEGTVKKMPRKQSKKYFLSRPMDSQISAYLSPQSQKINNFSNFKAEIETYKQSGEKPECPEFWGGYLLIPDYFEFWQGGKNRLHRRLIFEQKNNQWIKALLAP